MSKTIFLLLVIIIGSVACQEVVPQGDAKKCFEDLSKILELGLKIKNDWESKDLSSVVNDGVQIFDVAQSAYNNDCRFNNQISDAPLAQCFNDVKEMALLIRSKKSNQKARKFIPTLLDIFRMKRVAMNIQTDCQSTINVFKGEEPEPEYLERAIPEFAGSLTLIVNNPVQCVGHAIKFARDARILIKEVYNNTIPADEVLATAIDLVNEVPSLLEACDVQLPAWLNDTARVADCFYSFQGLYDTLFQIKNDYETKNITKIIADSAALFEIVRNIQSKCSLHQATEEPVEEIMLQSSESYKVPFPPKFPFNITDCLQSTTDLSALFGRLYNTIEAGESTNNIIGAISNIVVKIEPLLRTCGESQVADEIGKAVPEVCLVSLSSFAQLGSDIWNHREDTRYILAALGHVYTSVITIRDTCPLLHDMLPDLPDYDFEEHHLKSGLTATEEDDEEEEEEEEEDEDLSAFDVYDILGNVEECLDSAEIFTEEIQQFKSMIMVAAGDRNYNRIVETAESVYFATQGLLGECGFEDIADEIDRLLPEICVGALEELSDIVDTLAQIGAESQYGDYLKQANSLIEAIANKCPDFDNLENMESIEALIFNEASKKFEEFGDEEEEQEEEEDDESTADWELEEGDNEVENNNFEIQNCLEKSQSLLDSLKSVRGLVKNTETSDNYDDVVPAVNSLVQNIYAFLPACGMKSISENMEEVMPMECIESVSSLASFANEFIANRNNVIYVARNIRQFNKEIKVVQSKCPTVDLFAEEFSQEDLTSTGEIEIEEMNLESEKLFSFNVTQCIKSAEQLSSYIGLFEAAYNQKADFETTSKALIDVKNQLYVFLPTCGLNEVKNKMEDFIPEGCVDAAANFISLSHKLLLEEQILAEVIDILPEMYDATVGLKKQCPNVKPTGFLKKLVNE